MVVVVVNAVKKEVVAVYGRAVVQGFFFHFHRYCLRKAGCGINCTCQASGLFVPIEDSFEQN